MDCIDHCIAENSGHVQSSFTNMQGTVNEYNCLWRGCIRRKKNGPGFPHLQRLVKHVRDIHINKCSRIVLPADRNK